MSLDATSPKRPLKDNPDGAIGPAQKKHVTEDRQRVPRACDACRKKKARCTGTLPCPPCEKRKLRCTYDMAYKRGNYPPSPKLHLRAPDISSTTTQPDVSRRLVHSDGLGFVEQTAGLQAASNKHSIVHEHCIPNLRSLSADSVTQPIEEVLDAGILPDADIRNSPVPSHTDAQGQYLGSSSGMAFLSRARHRLQRKLAPSERYGTASASIFSFGDAPLPDYDAAAFMLPSDDEAKRLVTRYFNYSPWIFECKHSERANVLPTRHANISIYSSWHP